MIELSRFAIMDTILGELTRFAMIDYLYLIAVECLLINYDFHQKAQNPNDNDNFLILVTIDPLEKSILASQACMYVTRLDGCPSSS